MNATHDRAKSIFLTAAEIAAPGDRRAYVEAECAGDELLQREVDELLRHEESLGSFLESPAIDFAATTDPRPITERPGATIGPYRLLQQIGEGGMGVVFMAEQSAPIQRTVALKIIKPGMDTRQVIARFEAERQAVAMMDHPNIAKVLDAGTTDSGRPYFVMELVKGVPITKYCDDNQLPLCDRLELFVQVCQAVQHAHQKGIIHRDIKPNNVLVAEYDNRPVPKVIDFGVAKATAQRLTERTMFTEFGQIIGTVEYMSPEQAKLNQLDIDTRSDIYSLGVLLYELLAGETPFDREHLRSAAFDEALRIIREEEPPKPSTRLSSLSLEERAGSHPLPPGEGRGEGALDSASIAANRNVEPHQLTKLLSGELDWIVMKCLEKDRNRRFPSAGELAGDIARYLAGEPVSAAAPTRLYRITKVVRRNRVQVAAACLVTAAIVVGVAATGWQAVRARRAEHSALASAAAERAAREREAAQRKQAEDISNFLISAFNARYPDREFQAVAEVLQRSANDLQDAYSDSPSANTGLLATIGRSYAGLRRFGEAEQMYRRCLRVADDPRLTDWVRRELAACLLRQGKRDEGVAILQGFFYEKLRRSDRSPDGDELLEAWSGLSDVDATAHGNPGMDGLDLDGDRDYVILPRLYFDGRPPWTLEAIVRPVQIDHSMRPVASPVGWTSLISAADAGSIALDTNRRRWAIELYTAIVATGDGSKSYATAISHREVALRRWQHVAGVWDGKELRLYLGGELQQTRTGIDHCTQLSLSPMFLGADPANAALDAVAEGYLHGRLRQARISQSVEYTDSFPPPERLEKTSGTIGLYDFTIDTGRYAIDRSDNGNHGIIIGAKYVGQTDRGERHSRTDDQRNDPAKGTQL